jgi:hypothetical protein
VSVGSDASKGGGFHYFRLEVGGLAFLPLGLAGVIDLPAEEDPRLCLFFEEAAADTLALVSASKYIWYVSAEIDPRPRVGERGPAGFQQGLKTERLLGDPR